CASSLGTGGRQDTQYF
nr:T-cell receptor V beta CDR3 region {clone V5In5} [mice, NOD, islets, Peptide Partial, 16 aa] [Mus sp.]